MINLVVAYLSKPIYKFFPKQPLSIQHSFKGTFLQTLRQIILHFLKITAILVVFFALIECTLVQIFYSLFIMIKRTLFFFLALAAFSITGYLSANEGSVYTQKPIDPLAVYFTPENFGIRA